MNSTAVDDREDALAQSRREVDELRAELEETNRGVVALYAELDAQAEQLREATELKSRFLAYMSHEFRTPINAIRSIARLLSDRVDGPLTPEQEKQVGFIQHHGHRVRRDGRRPARPGQDRGRPGRHLARLVRDGRPVLRAARHVQAGADNPASPGVRGAEGLPKLYTDDRKLSQILRNFISNALKFTPHGEVRVTAMPVGDDAVRFSVSDTGIGIAPEHHAAVFDDFSQVDSPMQKRLRGTGLGLSLSRQLAVLLGGCVQVESELGKGSVFSVTLPVQLHGQGQGHGATPGAARAE
jgi:signal transduction histidine kinase